MDTTTWSPPLTAFGRGIDTVAPQAVWVPPTDGAVQFCVRSSTVYGSTVGVDAGHRVPGGAVKHLPPATGDVVPMVRPCIPPANTGGE